MPVRYVPGNEAQVHAEYAQLPQEVGPTLVSRAAATPTLRAVYPESSGFRVYQQFLSSHVEEAADSLAVLHHVAVTGFGGLDSEQRDAFGIARPYCLQSAGWGVFFEVAGPRSGPCMVTLLLVAAFARITIDQAKGEAIRRRDSAAERVES